jgi:hypothetical protein
MLGTHRPRRRFPLGLNTQESLPHRDQAGFIPLAAICAAVARSNADRSNPPSPADVKLNKCLATWHFGRHFPRSRFGVMLRALQVGRNMPVGLPLVERNR